MKENSLPPLPKPSRTRNKQTLINQQQRQRSSSTSADIRRQAAGTVGSKQIMSFGGVQQPNVQPQQISNPGITRSTLAGQSGQLPPLPRQAAGAVSSSQLLNMHSQLVLPRESSAGSGLQGEVSQGNSAMQSYDLISQIRENENRSLTSTQQNPMMRHHHQPPPLTTTPQAQQALTRTWFPNSHLSAMPHTGQPPPIHDAFSQQHWLKQMPMPPISTSNPPSYPFQHQSPQQLPLPQQLATSPPTMQLTSIAFKQPQQLNQIVESPSMGNPQLIQRQQHHQLPQQQQHQKQLLDHRQLEQSPKMMAPTGQKTLTITGSSASVITAQGGSSSQGTETSQATTHLLGKRRLQDLVLQVDSQANLDPEVEDLLLEIADNFIDSVTSFACVLAKHRKSSTVESKDVLLHLEKNLGLTIPGFSSKQKKQREDDVSSSGMRQQCLDMIPAFTEPSQADTTRGGMEATTQRISSPIGAIIR